MTRQRRRKRPQQQTLHQTNKTRKPLPMHTHPLSLPIIDISQNEQKQQKEHLTRRADGPHEESDGYRSLKFAHDDGPANTEREEDEGGPQGDEGFCAAAVGHGED
mmetsp:Transcript_15976/g.22687  ORF Transcript_15976/g.22687 Transcript_15976/m.22687 type:complete len:105 (-) Transcript_15976:189-503(-)